MEVVNMVVQKTKLKKVTKKELARHMGISRSLLYYQHKRPLIDEEMKRQIEAVLTDNPSYGHKRIALELKLNKKRILRVMKKFGIKPYRRRPKKPRKKEDEGKKDVGISNLIKLFCPMRPHVVWVGDFTYIKYKEKFIYLATVMDLYTREIIGWNISRFHNKELVLGAFLEAVKRTGKTPLYFHCDQGSEYDCGEYMDICKNYRINLSMSAKSHPWENGFQESFYSGFKLDLGDVNRFETLGELIEAIHQTINYYNTKRIHTALKMSPINFKNKYYLKTTETVSKKLGT